jgi:hypothetical protein
MKFIVVENAGYTGEKDVKQFSTFNTARTWMYRNYTYDEVDQLHVDIVLENNHGQRTYEY